MSAGLPLHLIAPDDVDAWLIGSSVRVVTYHNTDRRSADAILASGVHVERSWAGSFGQGFYAATAPDAFFGDVAVVVAVRLFAPLIGSIDEVADVVDQLVRRFSPLNPRITPSVGRRIRRELMTTGYDGIVVYDAGGDGIDYVIALSDEAVKIVADR